MSEITYNKDGTLSALVGKDAVHLMRIRTIISGIKLHLQTGGRIRITRGASITALLKLAGEYSKKKYKRTECQQAIDDLEIFFATLKSSLPESVRDN